MSEEHPKKKLEGIIIFLSTINVSLLIGIIALVFAVFSSFKLSSKLSESSIRQASILNQIENDLAWTSKTSNLIGRMNFMPNDTLEMFRNVAIDESFMEYKKDAIVTDEGRKALTELGLVKMVTRKFDNAKKANNVKDVDPSSFILRILSTGEFQSLFEEYNKKHGKQTPLEAILGAVHIYASTTKVNLSI